VSSESERDVTKIMRDEKGCHSTDKEERVGRVEHVLANSGSENHSRGANNSQRQDLMDDSRREEKKKNKSIMSE
jgi:hypothetical protein